MKRQYTVKVSYTLFGWQIWQPSNTELEKVAQDVADKNGEKLLSWARANENGKILVTTEVI